MKILVKVFLVVLLLLCLLKMPYGYYQFMRIAVCGLFAYLAYLEYKDERMTLLIACIGGVILFNPIAKLYFHKQQWQTIDLCLAFAIGIWVLYDVAHYVFYQIKKA